MVEPYPFQRNSRKSYGSITFLNMILHICSQIEEYQNHLLGTEFSGVAAGLESASHMSLEMLLWFGEHTGNPTGHMAHGKASHPNQKHRGY